MEHPTAEVCIVIPIYTNNLREEEKCALTNNLNVLNHYPCKFVYPNGFNIEEIHKKYPNVGLLQVSKNWLGPELGVSGYNKMMTSSNFYDLFSEYKYILICHSDAWIFRDELAEWCGKDYDNVAAPWPIRKRYNYFPFKQYVRIRTLFTRKYKISHYAKIGLIGNGGLSLRKVETFRKACIKYKTDIDKYINNNSEDVFWAVIPKNIKVPSVEEAMKFAFDIKPNFLYKSNNRQLPMGCHGFNKPSRLAFWKQFINCL